MIPYDLTDLLDRPNPGMNPGGQGCLAGLSPCSMFKPLRPGTLPAQYDKGAFVFEAEPGEGWDTDIRFVSETKAVSHLAEIVSWLKVCRRDKVQHNPITAYVLPIDWWAFAGKERKEIVALDAATDFIAKRVIGDVDGFMIDAHCFAQVPLETWQASVAHRFKRAASFGKPVDLVWAMEWHGASTPPSMQNKPLSEIDALSRIKFMQSLEPRGIFLMGGGYTINGRFTRFPVGNYPALPAIINQLTRGVA